MILIRACYLTQFEVIENNLSTEKQSSRDLDGLFKNVKLNETNILNLIIVNIQY